MSQGEQYSIGDKVTVDGEPGRVKDIRDNGRTMVIDVDGGRCHELRDTFDPFQGPDQWWIFNRNARFVTVRRVEEEARHTCNRCEGEGYIHGGEVPCRKCDGYGVVA